MERNQRYQLVGLDRLRLTVTIMKVLSQLAQDRPRHAGLLFANYWGSGTMY